MGILDSNIARVTGLQKIANVFVNQTAITPYQSNLVDCTKFNTIILSFKSVKQASSVQVAGYINNNVVDTNIAGIEITNHSSMGVYAKKRIIDVPVSYTRVFMYDVSKLTHIAVGKTEANGGSLTVTYSLTQDFFNDLLIDEGYFKNRIKNSTSSLNESNTGIDLTGVKTNACLLKITNTAELSKIPFIRRMGSSVLDIVSQCFNLSKDAFCSGNDIYPAGESLIVMPIERADSIYIYLTNLNSGSVSIDYKFVNFDFSRLGKKISYWEKQAGAIGNNLMLYVPDQANSCQVVVNGNPASSGMLVQFYGMRKTVDSAGSASKLEMINVLQLTDKDQSVEIDCSKLSYISFGSYDTLSDVKLQVIFSEKKVENINFNITKMVENEMFSISKIEGVRQNISIHKDIAVFWNANSLAISITGINGTQSVIPLDDSNFRGLIENSQIEKVIILPWTRNATASTGYSGQDWRMNVITNRGQIFHNFPSRAQTDDGDELDGDFKRFDESVVWDLETRKHPTKTNTGSDATLIATGKYRYYPALPDEAYEFHPALNNSNLYGHLGFGATTEQTQEDGTTIKFSRFYFTDRSRAYHSNPLGFMGGFEPDNKISALATYKSNTNDVGATRMCVFLTNDGGRQWYCRYEFGGKGELIDGNAQRLKLPETVYLKRNLIAVGMSANAGAGLYNVVKRRQFTPTEANKEPELTNKFSYLPGVAVQSITANAGDIIVTTATAHGLNGGDIILFEKQSGAASSQWDWIINDDHTAMSCTGIVFKVQQIDATSFRLMEEIHNSDNNLTCCHIHSLNRGKDHLVIGCGETYPHGWIIYVPIRESDSFARKYPWDKFDFIRLTSTQQSIQRPLGVVIGQDTDNTVFIGVDNELTDLGDVALPAGRTGTFKRSSQGVFRGKMIDADDSSKFDCVFETREVAYFFKKINGYYIYIGQQGHIGVSKSGEKGSWTEAFLGESGNCHFLGTATDGTIGIDRFLIKLK